MAKNGAFYETLRREARIHITAILTSHGELLAVGFNSIGGNVGSRVVKSVHSETDALMALQSKLARSIVQGRRECRRLTVLNLAVNHRGILKTSRPCLECARRLMQCEFISRVYWTIEGGRLATLPKRELATGALCCLGTVSRAAAGVAAGAVTRET